MRIILSIFTGLLTIALCFILDSKFVLPAPLGKLLAPQHGIWQNAEPTDYQIEMEIVFPYLKGKTDVFFDERLVPHVFAENESDVYFVQGYLHAKFRLWQMELQALAAAGRASEVAGSVALEHDRQFRRLGMVYAAENSLKAMEANPVVKAQCDAYTAGVNAYIESLSESELPVEYKIIGYKPERWSNFKSALFLKYMSYDLAARERDFELTNSRSYFNAEDFKLLFPSSQDSLDPIVPDTVVLSPAINITAPLDYDTIDFKSNQNIALSKPDPNNGSNNWVLAGSRTSTGSPILCNDPHLGLNLPSLWYEMQLSSPGLNVYGATFPGAPSVVIGFNDSIAWGVTNGGRDVRDYYEIRFKDNSRKQYWFNNEWLSTSFREEIIHVNGGIDFKDTVAYTVMGPVMYDGKFGDRSDSSKSYAVRWTAHDASNELLVFNKLNHASNYQDYLEAVSEMKTPGQNFAFASVNGDIAMRTAGRWPAKWKGQGDFLMPGYDSTYLWQGFIPNSETPSQYNPARGFVSSGNQRPADTSYPYYLGTDYPLTRGLTINRMLSRFRTASIEDMKTMQTDNFNVFGEMAQPLIIKNIQDLELTEDMRGYLILLSKWDFKNDAQSKGATIFEITWEEVFQGIFADEYQNAPSPLAWPSSTTLIEALLKDSSYKFTDNIFTPHADSLPEIITAAFRKAYPKIKNADSHNQLEWGKYKDTKIMHLAKLEPFSRQHLISGGSTHAINATQKIHGPSWRMIVSMTAQPEAYGVYPGGQSGNPGSKYYDNFINYWVQGNYYSLWMMKANESKDSRVIGSIRFKKTA